MKRVLYVAVLVCALSVGLVAVHGICAEPTQSIDGAAGFSMQSDGRFYVHLAAVDHSLGDITVALGLNNGVYVGVRGYIFPSDNLAGYFGTEIQPVKVEGITTLRIAVPVGFVVRVDRVAVNFGLRIFPVPDGDDIRTLFVISALYTFGGSRE